MGQKCSFVLANPVLGMSLESSQAAQGCRERKEKGADGLLHQPLSVPRRIYPCPMVAEQPWKDPNGMVISPQTAGCKLGNQLGVYTAEQFWTLRSCSFVWCLMLLRGNTGRPA